MYVYNESEKRVATREYRTRNINNDPLFEYVEHGDVRGFQMDISKVSVLKEQPFKQIFAALLDIGLAYSAKQVYDKIEENDNSTTIINNYYSHESHE